MLKITSWRKPCVCWFWGGGKGEGEEGEEEELVKQNNSLTVCPIADFFPSTVNADLNLGTFERKGEVWVQASSGHFYFERKGEVWVQASWGHFYF